MPVSPVQDFTVTDSADVDITAGYTLSSMSTHGVGLYRLAGAWLAGMTVTLPSGAMPTSTASTSAFSTPCWRYTSHLYEHREILTPGLDVMSPGWMTDVIATYWVPRA